MTCDEMVRAFLILQYTHASRAPSTLHRRYNIVRSHLRRWRHIASPLLLALIVSSLPLPCAAQGIGKQVSGPGLKASIDKAARTTVLNAPASAGKVTAQATGQPPSSGKKSFFTTPAGVVVLAIVAAGTGYAIYSSSHDRIPPTGR